MEKDDSLLDKLVPAPLAQLDAFPKLPSTYKTRSEGRGFLTLFVAFVTFLLMLNDIGEYIWGWPDYEFSVDHDKGSYMNINVDMVVNMPCGYLSIDLRDAVGDRLYLTGGIGRDGVAFDISQATALKEHAQSLSAPQAVKQSRSTRGIFDIFKQNKKPAFKPTFKHQGASDACRIYGNMEVKKVTANFHITSLGHGYASAEHVPHEKMNMSHVISEFSFGPFFPDITQPLDSSFEVATEPFVAYQYFLHIVPTTYIAPRSWPLHTNQYSVTHYTRVLQHGYGTPGIFFKFEIDPMAITITQRTTSLIQLIIRCVGVIGGVFVCMGYALRVGTRAVEVVTGADQANGIVAAEATGVKTGLKGKWGGSNLRARHNSQGTGWTTDNLTPGLGMPSPYLASPYTAGGVGPGTPGPYTAGFGPSTGIMNGSPSPAFGPVRTPSASGPPPPPSAGGYGAHSRTPSLRTTNGAAYTNGHSATSYSGSPSPANISPFGLAVSQPLPAQQQQQQQSSQQQQLLPGTPNYSHFPPTPHPSNGGGFFPTNGSAKKDD